MSRVDELLSQIKLERNNKDGRLEELEKSIEEDQTILDTYVERFTHAVQDSIGEEALTELEKQRNEALRRVEQNKAVLKILTSNDGSKIRRLNAELVEEYFKLLDSMEGKAESISKKLAPVFESLVSGLEEMAKINYSHISILRKIDSCRLDIKDAKRLGLMSSREIDGQRTIADDPGMRKIFPLMRQFDVSASQISRQRAGE